MSEAVLDASVVLKWFHPKGEAHTDVALTLRRHFEAGELRVLAPPLLWLEILNVASRRWRWSRVRLEELAETLPGLGFELLEPELPRLARWSAEGLTAYDAAYVAVAEQTGARLVTDDAEIVRAAADFAIALTAAGEIGAL